MLQDITTKEVRVDADQDGDFTDDTAMIDYKVKQDVGYFGTDNPATPVVERVAVRRADRPAQKQRVVNLGIVSGAHGTHVAGITAANKLFDGSDDRCRARREADVRQGLPLHRGLHQPRA